MAKATVTPTTNDEVDDSDAEGEAANSRKVPEGYEPISQDPFGFLSFSLLNFLMKMISSPSFVTWLLMVDLIICPQ